MRKLACSFSYFTLTCKFGLEAGTPEIGVGTARLGTGIGKIGEMPVEGLARNLEGPASYNEFVRHFNEMINFVESVRYII